MSASDNAKFPPVMASFKETREALLLSHASGFITDVEFLLLYEENMSDNLDFPYDEYPSFNLQSRMKPSAKPTLGGKASCFMTGRCT